MSILTYLIHIANSWVFFIQDWQETSNRVRFWKPDNYTTPGCKYLLNDYIIAGQFYVCLQRWKDDLTWTRVAAWNPIQCIASPSAAFIQFQHPCQTNLICIRLCCLLHLRIIPSTVNGVPLKSCSRDRCRAFLLNLWPSFCK